MLFTDEQVFLAIFEVPEPLRLHHDAVGQDEVGGVGVGVAQCHGYGSTEKLGPAPDRSHRKSMAGVKVRAMSITFERKARFRNAFLQ